MEKGVFQIDDLDMTAEIVHYSVKGIETPYIRGHIGANLDDAVRDTCDPSGTWCIGKEVRIHFINNFKIIWDY